MRVRGIVWLALVLVLGGCFGTTQLERNADRAAALHSPLIETVVYIQANFLDPESVNVYLVPGLSDQDVLTAWCKLLVPTGLTDLDTSVWRSRNGDIWQPPAQC